MDAVPATSRSESLALDSQLLVLLISPAAMSVGRLKEYSGWSASEEEGLSLIVSLQAWALVQFRALICDEQVQPDVNWSTWFSFLRFPSCTTVLVRLVWLSPGLWTSCVTGPFCRRLYIPTNAELCPLSLSPPPFESPLISLLLLFSIIVSLPPPPLSSLICLPLPTSFPSLCPWTFSHLFLSWPATIIRK